MVYEQNGIGQNGMNKMVYGQNGIGQNGTDKIVANKTVPTKIINQSINPAPTGKMIFSSIPLPL